MKYENKLYSVYTKRNNRKWSREVGYTLDMSATATAVCYKQLNILRVTATQRKLKSSGVWCRYRKIQEYGKREIK